MQDPHDLEEKVKLAVRDFAKSVNSKGKVLADMTKLSEVTGQLALSSFDYWERLIRTEYSNALDARVHANWKFWDKPSQILTWLDLISWDGYRREKALRTLNGAAPNSFFLILSLRRLNDWVPEVRQAAREQLPLIVKDSNPFHVIEALCATLPHWSSWGRIGESDKAVILALVSKSDVGEALKSKIASSTSGPMNLLMSQVGRTEILDKHLIEIAETASQPAVRARAYRTLFESRMVWMEGRKWEWTDIRYCKGRLKPIVGERKILQVPEFEVLIHKSAADASPIVRKIAAEFLIRELERMDDEKFELANKFAQDKSRSVAERGSFALQRLKKQSEH